MNDKLVLLKSVGTYLDTETLYIYPELAIGGYDQDLFGTIYEEEINPEFWERMSREDYLKVVKVLINKIK